MIYQLNSASQQPLIISKCMSNIDMSRLLARFVHDMMATINSNLFYPELVFIVCYFVNLEFNLNKVRITM